MRGHALCLVAAAIVVAGCGSGGSSPSSAPKQQKVAASGGNSLASAGVSAKGRATPASLCTPEGKGRPKKQCVAGLTKLSKGKAANPKAACKGLSKKKAKGVRGKSPFAVCVSAAAKLMASRSPAAGGGNGSADSSGSDAGSDTTGDNASGSSSSTEADPVCRDANGKTVPFDSEDVEECDPPADANDSASADDSSTDISSADDSPDSSSDDGN